MTTHRSTAPARTETSSPERRAHVVTKLFALLDAGDLNGAAELFSADAIYLRPGFGEFVGRAAIADFLFRLRPMVSSEHVLDSVVFADVGEVAVRGGFRGRLRDGTPSEGRFADFFLLDAQGLIHRRETFFARS